MNKQITKDKNLGILKNKLCGRDSIQDFKIQKILKVKNRKREENL